MPDTAERIREDGSTEEVPQNRLKTETWFWCAQEPAFRQMEKSTAASQMSMKP
jgi:hypothetical protein